MRSKPLLVAAALLVMTACATTTPSETTSDTTTTGGAIATTEPTTPSAPTTSAPNTTEQGPKNMGDLPEFQVVEAGEYYVEPNPGTSTRVSFTVPEGWLSWAGTFKPSPENEDEYVGVTIATVTELIDDPCLSRSWSDPGPTVADLADGLAALPGMVVIEAPNEVTAFGFDGQHLMVEVPDIPFDPARGSDGFLDCVSGSFHAWRGPLLDDRYYQGPRQSLEFWVLDVQGERLLIEKTHFPQSTATDLVELDSVVDSILIEP